MRTTLLIVIIVLLAGCDATDPRRAGGAADGKADGLAASCVGQCGGVAGGCWCDDACTELGDCCDDAPLCKLADDPISSLFVSVASDQAWDDLGPVLQGALREKARRRHEVYREQWGGQGMSDKAWTVSQAPTPAMLSQLDSFVANQFVGVVPEGFQATRDVANLGLRHALIDLAIATYGSSRISMVHKKKSSPLDWDGVSKIDGIPLPDPQAMAEQAEFAQRAIDDLEQLAASSPALSPVEEAIRVRSIILLRSLRSGSRFNGGFGGSDLEIPSVLPDWGWYAMWANGDAAGNAYATDDDLLETLNALWMASLDQVNVGTVMGGAKSTFDPHHAADQVKQWVGDPAQTEVGRQTMMFSHWWWERVTVDPARCTIYSDAQRDQVWDSFTADQLADPAGGMEEFELLLDQYAAELTPLYRAAAVDVLDQLFPGDSVVTPSQRAKVKAALAGEDQFAAMTETLRQALTAATGSPSAAATVDAALAGLEMLGGGYAQIDEPVRPEELAALNAMWAQVRTYLDARFSRPGFDVDSLLPAAVGARVHPVSSTSNLTGAITIGVWTKRSKALYYGILIHEAHHSITSRYQLVLQGPAWEGAATHAENQLLPEFLAATLPEPALAGLYMLDQAQSEVRFIGTTAATLAVYLRQSCGPDEPDSFDYANQVASSWGVPVNAAARAHRGTQYFQYLWGRAQIDDVIRFFEDSIDPGIDNGITAYHLLACGIPWATKSAQDLERLTSCLDES